MNLHLRSGSSYKNLTIGLFGGSFNPTHEGHIAMATYALKQLALDQVWLLVSPQNPLKDGKAAPLHKRISKAQSLVHHPKVKVTGIETLLKTTCTADTLLELQKRFPATRFVWLMGADNLRQIPRWKRWQDIFYAVPVAVFRRPAYAAGRGLGKAALRFAHAWKAPSSAKLLKQRAAPCWIILDNKLNYLSSTHLRKEHPSW